MRFRITLIIPLFLLLTSQLVLGQRTLSYEADSIFCEAKSLYRVHKYDDCLLALEKSNAMFLEDKNWESYVETLAQLGVQTAVLKDSIQGHAYIDRAIYLADSFQLIDKHIHSVTVAAKGNAYYWKGAYEPTLFYWEKALEILKTSPVLDNEYYLSMLNNLAYLYEVLGDYEKSTSNHLESAKIAEETYGRAHPKSLYRINKWLDFLVVRKEYNKVWSELLKRKADYESLDDSYVVKADFYWVMARYYIAREDYTEATSYLSQAESIYTKLNSTSSTKNQRLYATWAVLEESQENFEEALPYYKKSLEFHRANPYKSVHSVATSLMNVGNCYTNMGVYNKALVYLNEAIDALEESSVTGFYMARLYYYRALMYLKKGNYDLAIDDLEYALNELSDDEGIFGEITGKYNFKIGICYQQKGLNNKANEYFDKGASYFQHKSDTAAIFSIGEKRVFSELLLAKMNLAFAPDTEIDVAAMQEVLKMAETVDQLLRHMINHSRSEDSKLGLSDMFHENSTTAIKACYKLFELSSDKTYMSEAFLWSAKGKANLLQTEIKADTDKLKANLPDSLLEKEFKINAAISFYEEKLFDPSTDQKDASWNKLLVDLRLEREQIISHYESYYPKYFELKYGEIAFELEEIQSSLDSNESLLDYFLGEDALYVFVINQQSTYFKRILLEEDLRETIHLFREALKTSDFDSYTKTAYQLYKTLIYPVQEHINGHELYVVPHDVISYLPFDALILEQAKSKAYHKLAYLTKTYDISYLYNSKLMNRSFKKSATEGYLGIVPNYEGEYKTLRYAEKEVDDISRSLSGKKVVGRAATETYVRNKANKYNILHFASHAEVNPDRAMLSRLLLEGDTLNDGSLHTYELYNMELSSSLVVLNACSTGEGKLYAADGIISLASAFQFAGCESVFMNLWEVPDRSSSVLVTNFFKHLKDGACKRSALSMAKRDYLAVADEHTANPIFWAGAVVSGNLNPIETQDNYIYYLITAAFLLLFALLYFFKK